MGETVFKAGIVSLLLNIIGGLASVLSLIICLLSLYLMWPKLVLEHKRRKAEKAQKLAEIVE